MLVDTHCHLADPAYDADREAVLRRAADAGVGAVVLIGDPTDGTAARNAALLALGPALRAVAGVHPHHASRWDADAARALEAALDGERVVALGEIGLDYHYEHSPRAAQRAAFEAQLAIAERRGLPVVVHAREADDDVAAVLEAAPRVPAVLHSFSSGPRLLDRALALGHYASFSGMVTFRSWRLDDCVRAVPADRLLVETDGPYLAPVPHRGRRNEPAWVAHTLARVAEVRGEDPATAAERTTVNAERLFGALR